MGSQPEQPSYFTEAMPLWAIEEELDVVERRRQAAHAEESKQPLLQEFADVLSGARAISKEPDPTLVEQFREAVVRLLIGEDTRL